MIQRIQSVYLLLAAILMAVTVVSPLVTLHQTISDSRVLFDSLGFFTSLEPNKTLSATWGVISIAVLAAIFIIINIFLFKNRKLQVNMCKCTSVLILLFYVTFATYLYFAINNLSLEFSNIDFGIFLPIVALIFNLLAGSRIKSDLKLIESLNRIR